MDFGGLFVFRAARVLVDCLENVVLINKTEVPSLKCILYIFQKMLYAMNM